MRTARAQPSTIDATWLRGVGMWSIRWMAAVAAAPCYRLQWNRTGRRGGGEAPVQRRPLAAHWSRESGWTVGSGTVPVRMSVELPDAGWFAGPVRRARPDVQRRPVMTRKSVACLMSAVLLVLAACGGGIE